MHAAMPEDATRSLTGRGVYPPKFAWLLTLPLRRLIISPEALADRLALTDSPCNLGEYSPEPIPPRLAFLSRPSP